MIAKLKQNKGETLMEALVSLLIAVLAVSLVASAALAAANINKSTNLADKKFTEELEAVEIYDAPLTSKNLEIQLEDGTFLQKEDGSQITVNVYGDGSNFASYKE